MLKQRVIAVLLVHNGWLVQSLGFERYLPVGRPEIAAEFLDEWGVDEIVLVDIDATKEARTIDGKMVERVAERIFTPLCVGGGIRTVDTVRRMLAHGADKVLINAALTDRNFLERSAERFGRQCLVGAIDLVWRDGEICRYDYRTGCTEGPVCGMLDSLPVGELLVQAVERDGCKCGYDVAIYRTVADCTNLPLIALGGAGDAYHLRRILDEVPRLSAVAAANYFHFSEHLVAVTKAILKKDRNRPIRHDGWLQYAGRDFDLSGRVGKLDEKVLGEMMFEPIVEEKI